MTVSVIIPTFNRATFVVKAIESVLTQSYKDCEIIVVDDGSVDNTKEVLEAYTDKIKYIYQENAGVSKARNAGIRAASGQWTAFLDSDDTWLPDKLTRQLECVNRTGAKVCFTNTITFDGKRVPPRSGNTSEIAPIREKIFTDPFELILAGTPRLYLPTMLVARSLLRMPACFDERLTVGEDTRLIYDLAFESAFAFIYTPHVIINRTEGRTDLTNDSPTMCRNRCSAQVSILSDVYFRCRKKNRAVVAKLSGKLAYSLSRVAEIACVDEDYVDARRFAKDALHFGGDLKTHLRSLAVWLCPRLVGRIRRHYWS